MGICPTRQVDNIVHVCVLVKMSISSEHALKPHSSIFALLCSDNITLNSQFSHDGHNFGFLAYTPNKTLSLVALMLQLS